MINREKTQGTQKVERDPRARFQTLEKQCGSLRGRHSPGPAAGPRQDASSTFPNIGKSGAKSSKVWNL